MKNKIVAIVVLMLVTTTTVSATNINVKECDNNNVNSEPHEPDLFDWWCVDQKQTVQNGYGSQQTPLWTNAQSFIPSKDKLTAVSLYFFKAGTPTEPVHITVSIRDNLTGSDLATKTIDTSVVTIEDAKWVLFDFEDISITPESKYYIVCSGDSGNANNAYCWLFSGNDTYTRGEAWGKVDDNPWIVFTSGVGDYCFKTYFRKPLDVSSIPKNNEMVNPVKYSVDVPVWKKGDSWTYDFHRTEYRYNGSTLWFTEFFNCTATLTVIDDTGDYYTIKLTTKNNEGRADIGSYRLKFTTLTKLTDELKYQKTDLAQTQEVWQTKGPVFWLLGSIGLPIPAQYNSHGQQTITPSHLTLPFPLAAGASGTLPGYSYTIQEKCALYWGLITLFDNPENTYSISPTPYLCEMANVTVPAGTYNTYNVSVDFPIGTQGHYSWWQYYVPEVGNTVKWSIDSFASTKKPYAFITAELIDYNYTP
jgi:hypothetical protein